MQIICAENSSFSVKKEPETTIRTLLIIQIKETDQAYFILTLYNREYYTILSLKAKDENCMILEEGKEYDFLVTSYFEKDRIPRLELSLEVIVDGVKLYVPMRGNNVFLTPNLKGLCYTPPQTDTNFQPSSTENSQNTDNFGNTVFRIGLDKTPIANSLPLKYRVYRIKEIDKAYIIDIDLEGRTKDDLRGFRYTIISLKNDEQNFKKIKQGKQYEFVLFSYYPFTLLGDYRFAYYTIDGVCIGFEGDYKTGEIVTTPNLKGLYYIPCK